MIASLRAAAVLAAASFPALLPAQQQATAKPPAPVRSVPVSNLRYEITFDSATAQRNVIAVAVSFDVAEKGAVLLSFPSWTPGSYVAPTASWWCPRTAAGTTHRWPR